MVIYQNIFSIKFSARFLHKPSSVNWFKDVCIKGFCTNMIQTCDATKSIYCFFLLAVGNAWICLLAVLRESVTHQHLLKWKSALTETCYKQVNGPLLKD